MAATEVLLLSLIFLATAIGIRAIFATRRAQAALAEAIATGEKLQDEVWELKATAAALGRAEAASEAKSRFLATVSHEFRTPLNGIVGMTDMLAETHVTAEQASYLETIRASATALSSLINEILDFSRIEAGKVELVAEPFDLPALVEGVVELLAPRAQDKGLEIASTVAPDLPRIVIGDAGRLRQVLLNLGGNAVKFTRDGGVGLRVEAGRPGLIRFTVADTGPGVPYARRQAIFQDFEQADGSSSRQHEGTGLGLAISRRLIGLMGGELRLENSGAEGSVFAFEVALAPGEVEISRVASSDLTGRRALIVAANPFGADFLGERLAVFGADVRRANGAAEGLKILDEERNPPLDMVIVDCALGESATQELAAAARRAGVAQSLVLFSPFERRAFGDAVTKDFDGWLVKPVRLESLRARLDRKPTVVATRQADAQLFPGEQKLAGRRFLLAEDNDVNALLVIRRLTRLGADVVRAHDGLEAVRLAESSIGGDDPPFDAILMDVRMPELDGLAAVGRIREVEARHSGKRNFVIALTANAFDDDRRAATEAGMDAFLTKPVDFDVLIATVESNRPGSMSKS